MPIPAGALTVDAVEHGGNIILVVDTTGMGSGPLLLRGTVGDESWWVRGCRGGTEFTDGDVFFLTDPLAPLNVEITYTLTAPDGATQSNTATRHYDGQHLVTDLRGTSHVDVFRHRDFDERDFNVRTSFFDIPGRSRPVVRYDRASGESVTYELETAGQTTRQLREIIQSGQPVIVLHNPDHCNLPDCDVEGSEVAAFTSVQHRLSANTAQAERAWSLGLRFIDDPLADHIIPISTVGDFNDYWSGSTVGDHDNTWSARTVGEHRQVVWA